MLKIVICCGAGMSSSFLAQRLQREVEKRGLQDEINVDFYPLEAAGVANAKEKLENYDVAMCCPHLKIEVNQISKMFPDLKCALYIMPPKMYGTLYFDEVIQDAKDVKEAFDKTHMIPFHFPGEENPMMIRRCEAYRNRHQHKYD